MAAEKAKDDDDESPAYVAVVDLKAGKVIRRIRGGMETEGIEFSADGKHILVTNEADDNITVHNIASGKKVKTIDVKSYGDRPRGIKRAPDGKAETYTGGRNFGHVAYAVDDIYATCRRLQEHGVLINRPPRDGRMAFVRSPDQISIELLQRGQPLAPAEPWASMPNTGSW